MVIKLVNLELIYSSEKTNGTGKNWSPLITEHRLLDKNWNEAISFTDDWICHINKDIVISLLWENQKKIISHETGYHSQYDE